MANSSPIAVGHGDHRHEVEHALGVVFCINATYLVVELVAGIMTGSLALLSDAGHMLSDVGALAIAWAASRLSRRRATARRTYGYGRAEILAALINGLILWLLVGAIFLEAIKRLFHPPEVLSGPMLAVGAAGLILNLVSVSVLFRHRQHNLNLRGAFLHVIGDSLGSIGVVAASLLILKFDWHWADPLASFFIGGLILFSSWGLIRDSVHILLEGTPAHLNPAQIRAHLEAIDGVRACHDLHIWLIGSGEPILTAHLDAQPAADRSRLLREATQMLADRHQIEHVTIQVEKETLPEPHHE